MFWGLFRVGDLCLVFLGVIQSESRKHNIRMLKNVFSWMLVMDDTPE